MESPHRIRQRSHRSLFRKRPIKLPVMMPITTFTAPMEVSFLTATSTGPRKFACGPARRPMENGSILSMQKDAKPKDRSSTSGPKTRPHPTAATSSITRPTNASITSSNQFMPENRASSALSIPASVAEVGWAAQISAAEKRAVELPLDYEAAAKFFS